VWLAGSIVGSGRVGAKWQLGSIRVRLADAGTETEMVSFLDFMLYLLINISN
jgi:hypothetical protein